MSTSVLVTGSSSGIGLATVKKFSESGYQVTATVRKAADEERLKNCFPGINILNLDLRDETAINTIIGAYFKQQNGVDIVVNNAGFACIGAIEELSLDQWRAQMETNFFATVNICRMVIPYMRKNKWGRVIQISSGAGKSVIPIFGPYCTSKHALEAFSVALRYEVAQFGIGVSIIGPGPVKSKFDDNREVPDSDTMAKSPYAKMVSAMRKQTHKAHKNESSAQDVVQKIMHAATTRKPKLRYEVGPLGYAASLSDFIPSSLLEFGMKVSAR